MTTTDSSSAAAVQSWLRRGQGSVWPCEEVCATYRFRPDGRLEADRSPAPSVFAQLLGGVVPAAWDSIRTPVLAIYVDPTAAEQMFPYVQDTDSANAARASRAFERWRRAFAVNRAAFERAVPSARVEVMTGVPHYLFLEAPDVVESLMRDFLQSLRTGAMENRGWPDRRTGTKRQGRRM